MYTEATCSECNIDTSEWIMVHSYHEVKILCFKCFNKKLKAYDLING
jgi:hypothetical protein